jgi:hypothetical protein
MRSLRRYVVVLVILSLAGAALAQEVWRSKPYSEWTKAEAETVLNNSPWSDRAELRVQFDKHSQRAAGIPPAWGKDKPATDTRIDVSTDIPVDFIFTLRLRSALPMRKALARLKLLDTDIEKLSPKELAAFDAQTKGLLECPACATNYVVTLSCKSRNSPGADAVYTSFKGGQLADLQRFIYIANERGEKRALVHFIAPRAPGDEAVFFFPRLDDKGAPLLTPENKELIINLADKQVNSVANFKLDVAKLVDNGKVEF